MDHGYYMPVDSEDFASYPLKEVALLFLKQWKDIQCMDACQDDWDDFMTIF